MSNSIKSFKSNYINNNPSLCCHAPNNSLVVSSDQFKISLNISDKKLKLNVNSEQRQSPTTSSSKPLSLKSSLPQRPPALQRSKRLVPSIDVSVQQTLNEHAIVPLVIEQKADQIGAVKLNASEPYASYNILSSRARASTLKSDRHSTQTGSGESSGNQNVRQIWRAFNSNKN